MNLNDPFGRSRLPPAFDRVHRIRLFREMVDAALEGRMPSTEARLFFGSAGAAYLAQGGDLVRDHPRISGPRGSHRTPAKVLAELDDEPHRDEGEDPDE
jgi:hypothetical protein